MSVATNWEDAYRVQVESINELRSENADLRGTLDAVIAADGRAVDLWRAAHPGKDLVIPDRAKLVGWLLEQNAALKTALDHQTNYQRELRADRERILTRLREILHTFTLHFSEPWRVNKELSGDATPFSIESVARVNIAGEALRKARTKKQKEHAFLLRQIAVFIRTQEGIGAKARYDLYRLLEESTPQSGEGKQ